MLDDLDLLRRDAHHIKVRATGCASYEEAMLWRVVVDALPGDFACLHDHRFAIYGVRRERSQGNGDGFNNTYRAGVVIKSSSRRRHFQFRRLAFFQGV